MNHPSFWVGVWAQPVESFTKWAGEGINLIIRPDPTNGNTAVERRAQCAAHGLFYIDQPADAADTLSMMSDPWCYGVMYPDEPQAPWYSADPVGFAAAVKIWNDTWTPILGPAKGKKPIWINFAGGAIMAARPWNNGGQSVPFASLADEVCSDQYPITTNFQGQWDSWNAGIGQPVDIKTNTGIDPLAIGTTEPQYCTRLLKQFFPGKPVWSYLETCKYDLNPAGRQMTAQDIQVESASIVKEGLKGLVYFVHNFNGPGWDPAGGPGHTDWDGRTVEVAAACKALTLSLTGSTPDLQKQINDLGVRVSAIEAKLLAVKNSL